MRASVLPPTPWVGVVDLDESGVVPAIEEPRPILTKATLEDIVARVSFMDRRFRVLEKGDGFLLQLEYEEACVETGELRTQRARKWYVSPHATETEVVETLFAACQRSMLHVTAEHFTYQGRRVFSPHFRIEDRLELAGPFGGFDKRPDHRGNR